MNENSLDGPSPGVFASRYFAFAARGNSLQDLSSGPIGASIVGDDGSVSEHRLVVADVAVGDFDGDSVDELVFGGLEDVIGSCESPPDPVTGESGLKHSLVVAGNRYNDFAMVAALPYASTPSGCDQANGLILRFAHVNVLDFDGDGDGDGDNEIQINDRIFEGPVEGEVDPNPFAQIFGTS